MANFGFGTLASLRSEYRDPEDEQDQEDHGEDVEQNARDIGGCCGDSCKSQYAGNDRNDEKDESPFQN